MNEEKIINEECEKIIKVYYNRDDRAAIKHFRDNLIERFAAEKDSVYTEGVKE